MQRRLTRPASPRPRPTVGLVKSHLVDLQQEQWLGAVDAARACGVDLVTFVGMELASPYEYEAQSNVIYDLLDPERLDGLIIWTPTIDPFTGPGRVEELFQRFGSGPRVSVEHEFPGIPSVLMDDRGGMYGIVSHLIERHGLRQISFLRGPEAHAGAELRFQGYVDALRDHGLPYDPTLVAPSPPYWRPDRVQPWIEELFERGGHDVQAIVAANDFLALAVLTSLADLGVRVPGDVAVAGYDDLIDVKRPDMGLPYWGGTEAAHVMERVYNQVATTMPLTTVRAPFYDLGREAVELVVAQLRGQSVPDVVQIDTQLRIQRSCGCFSEEMQGLRPGGPRPDRRSRGTDDAPGRPSDGLAKRLAPIRARLGSDLERVVGERRGLPARWADRLIEAFVSDLTEEASLGFIELIGDLIRASTQRAKDLEDWVHVLRTLQRETDPYLRGHVELDHAQARWLQVQVLLRETAERFAMFEHLVAEKRLGMVSDVGQRMISSLTVEELATVVAQELPKIGIEGCYLAMYVDLDPVERPAPTAYARAALAIEERRLIQLPADQLFRSSLLEPGRLAQRTQPASLVAMALHFKDQQIGFVLFEVGPRVGWVYLTLRDHLSTALEAALLVEREKRALAEVEEAREKVEAARAELEQRVAARTSELARANEDLREQMVERLRAEEMQARLESQLRQAQKIEAIGRLAGGIAHDFNNLLVVINGYGDLLLESMPADDPRHKDLEQIRQAGERAAELTRQLLAFGRKQLLQPRVLDLNGVVAGVETMLQRLIGEDIELVTRLGSSGAVRADPGQVEQIIINLAVNARDAMPGGGRLTIETDTVYLDRAYADDHVGVFPGLCAMIRVSDTGTGMDRETKAHLFEPFFTTKPPGQGTGLGLATVFGIVQQSGGHIDVSSQPGRGTTFTLYLPQATEEASDRGSSEPPEPSRLGSETILLVEDDGGVRAVTRRFLEQYGYRVLEAPRATDALDLHARLQDAIDLVITDMVMPELSGRDLAERLAAVDPHLPVIFVSGYADKTVGQPMFESDAVLVQKPFTAESLAATVRGTLEAARLREERRRVS